MSLRTRLRHRRRRLSAERRGLPDGPRRRELDDEIARLVFLERTIAKDHQPDEVS